MKALKTFLSFFAKVDGSRKGLIVPEELFRAIVSAVGSGAILTFAIGGLQLVVDHASVVFPNPAVAGLASAILTLILDLLRRQNQGPTQPEVVRPATVIDTTA
ncbi:hypothetical protein TA3x_000912 [Tundrisphaera sp. TA3]|uniref:hypothetical protein n=1 Tax=Tundrisphaera sp. TA3 TaxID=3435775 RepID=UPI003EBCEE97